MSRSEPTAPLGRRHRRWRTGRCCWPGRWSGTVYFFVVYLLAEACCADGRGARSTVADAARRDPRHGCGVGRGRWCVRAGGRCRAAAADSPTTGDADGRRRSRREPAVHGVRRPAAAGDVRASSCCSSPPRRSAARCADAHRPHRAADRAGGSCGRRGTATRWCGSAWSPLRRCLPWASARRRGARRPGTAGATSSPRWPSLAVALVSPLDAMGVVAGLGAHGPAPAADDRRRPAARRWPRRCGRSLAAPAAGSGGAWPSGSALDAIGRLGRAGCSPTRWLASAPFVVVLWVWHAARAVRGRARQPPRARPRAR